MILIGYSVALGFYWLKSLLKQGCLLPSLFLLVDRCGHMDIRCMWTQCFIGLLHVDIWYWYYIVLYYTCDITWYMYVSFFLYYTVSLWCMVTNGKSCQYLLLQYHVYVSSNLYTRVSCIFSTVIYSNSTTQYLHYLIPVIYFSLILEPLR